MPAFTTNDFASLLDDAIAAAEHDQGRARPTIPFDMLESDLYVGAAGTDATAAAEYLFAAAGDFSVAPDLSVLMQTLPSTDPLDIAAELGLTGRESATDLDRIRREFAFANHPDRVPADMRECAMQRMQFANTTIDQAKRRVSRTLAA